MSRATYLLVRFSFRLVRLHDHPLDAMDQFECAVLTGVERLRRLAPAAVEQCVGRGDARRMGRVLGAHHAGQGENRGPCMAACQRSNVGKSLGHALLPLRLTMKEDANDDRTTAQSSASQIASAISPATAREIR